MTISDCYKNVIIGLLFSPLLQITVFCRPFEKNQERRGFSATQVLNLLKKYPNFQGAPLAKGDTPLHMAVRWGLCKEFSNLLNNPDINIHTVNDDGDTALHEAAIRGYKTFVEALLAKGAEINQQGYQNNTPLIFAAMHGKTNVVVLLLKNGANLNSKNDFGDTALHCAVKKGDALITEKLLEYNASLNEFNNDKQTPFDLAQDETIINILCDYCCYEDKNKKIKMEAVSPEY